MSPLRPLPRSRRYDCSEVPTFCTSRPFSNSTAFKRREVPTVSDTVVAADRRFGAESVRRGQSVTGRSTERRRPTHRSNHGVVDDDLSFSSDSSFECGRDLLQVEVDDAVAAGDDATRDYSASSSTVNKKRSHVLLPRKERSDSVSKKQRLDGQPIDFGETVPSTRSSDAQRMRTKDKRPKETTQTSDNEREIADVSLSRSSTGEAIQELEQSFNRMHEILEDASKKVDRICKSRDNGKKENGRSETAAASAANVATRSACKNTRSSWRAPIEKEDTDSVRGIRGSSPDLFDSDTSIYGTDTCGRQTEVLPTVAPKHEESSTDRSSINRRQPRNVTEYDVPTTSVNNHLILNESEGSNATAAVTSRRRQQFRRFLDSSDCESTSESESREAEVFLGNVAAGVIRKKTPKKKKRKNHRRFSRILDSSSSESESEATFRRSPGRESSTRRPRPMRARRNSSTNRENVYGDADWSCESDFEVVPRRRHHHHRGAKERRRVDFEQESPVFERSVPIRPSRTAPSFRHSERRSASRSVPNRNGIVFDVSESESDDSKNYSPWLLPSRRAGHRCVRSRGSHQPLSWCVTHDGVHDLVRSGSDSEIEVLHFRPYSSPSISARRSSSLDRRSHASSALSRRPSSSHNRVVRRSNSSETRGSAGRYPLRGRRSEMAATSIDDFESVTSSHPLAAVRNHVPEGNSHDRMFEMEQMQADEMFARCLQAEYDAEYASAANVAASQEQARDQPESEPLSLSPIHSPSTDIGGRETRSARARRQAVDCPQHPQTSGNVLNTAVRHHLDAQDPVRLFHELLGGASTSGTNDGAGFMRFVAASNPSQFSETDVQRRQGIVQQRFSFGMGRFPSFNSLRDLHGHIMSNRTDVGGHVTQPVSGARVRVRPHLPRRVRAPRPRATHEAHDENRDYEALLLLDDLLESVPRGLTHQEINHLPKCKANCKTSGTSGSDTPKECLICLASYVDGESQRILPCFHYFHAPCIDAWLRTSNTCPVCRHVITVDPEDASPY